MWYCRSTVGIIATVFNLVFCIPQRAPFRLPNNATIGATNLTSIPDSFSFVIEGCDIYTGSLLLVLTKALAALTPALNDVKLGADSLHGFKTLFKDGATSTYVGGILRSIASAQSSTGLAPYPSVPSRPRFACVTPSTSSQYKFLEFDPWIYCNQHGAAQAFYVGDTSYIMLCPSFWGLEMAPRKSTCPPVVRNVFPGSGVALSWYMTYLIIHEMVHFYLGQASLGPLTDPPETYSINDCVALDSLDSVHNPQNYQYYVALTEQGCTNFPDLDLPPWPRNQGKSIYRSNIT